MSEKKPKDKPSRNPLIRSPIQPPLHAPKPAETEAKNVTRVDFTNDDEPDPAA